MKTSSIIKILAAATLGFACAAQAAPQAVVKLPRVVITASSTAQAVVQLPRVVIVADGHKALKQQQLLAATGAGKALRAHNG